MAAQLHRTHPPDKQRGAQSRPENRFREPVEPEAHSRDRRHNKPDKTQVPQRRHLALLLRPAQKHIDHQNSHTALHSQSQIQNPLGPLWRNRHKPRRQNRKANTKGRQTAPPGQDPRILHKRPRAQHELSHVSHCSYNENDQDTAQNCLRYARREDRGIRRRPPRKRKPKHPQNQ